MNTQNNMISVLLGILCSGGFMTIITFLLTRKRAKSEILFNSTSAYSTMLNDFKKQLDNQAAQILTLQNKETEYLKIIGGYQARESELLKRVSQLEAKILTLQSQQNGNVL